MRKYLPIKLLALPILAAMLTWQAASGQCSCPANPAPPATPILSLDVVAPGNAAATLTATGNNQVLCLRSSVGAGTFSGIIDFAGFSGVTLCIGPNVTFGYNASITNFTGTGYRITNNGTFSRRSFPAPFPSLAVTFNNVFSLTNNGTANFGDPFFSSLYTVSFNSGATITNTSGAVIYIYGNLVNNTNVTNAGAINVENGGISLGGAFTQAGGTITSTGTIVATRSATVSGGTLTLIGSLLRVTGNYTQTGGNVGGGSVLTGCGSVNVDGVSSISGTGVFGAGTGLIGLCDPSTRNVNGNATGFDDVDGPPGQRVPGNSGGPASGNGRLKCDCFVALPVELLYFRATASAGQVVLNWATASEKDNDYFTLERAADGVAFTEVARTDGAGTSSRLNTYQAADASPLGGTAYYRLKQTDLDGKFTYSRVVAVKAGVATASARVFPNPVAHDDYVQVDVPGGGVLSVTVFNQIGKQCFSATYPAGTLPSISVGHITRSGGLYILQARRGNTVIREKLVVQ